MRFLLFLTGFIAANCIAIGQVDLQTGAAEFSIPIYKYADHGDRISVGATLVYTNGSGFKVSEISSAIGTGWELACGGFVQRNQRGEPDDQKINYTTSTNYTYNPDYFPNGYLYSGVDPFVMVDNGGGYTPLFFGDANYMQLPIYIADREQDMFSFSFNGKSGSFFIGKNGEIKTVIDSKLKIQFDTTDMFNSGVRTKISEFRIIDEEGIKYTFRDLDLSEVIKYDNFSYYMQNGASGSGIHYSQSTAPAESRQVTKGTGIGQYIVSKWNLSEIANPLTNTKIQLSYDSYSIAMDGNKVPQVTTMNNNENKVSLTVERIQGIFKRIKSIVCSPKERVDFVYSSNYRIDVPTDKSLKEIHVKYDDQLKYKWKFSQGYFLYTQVVNEGFSFTNTDKLYARLCLKSVQKEGEEGLAEPPHTFAYNLGERQGYSNDIVPPMFSAYTDHWGYRNYIGFDNGITSEFFGPPTYSQNYGVWGIAPDQFKNPSVAKQPIAGYAETGTLKSIQYPYGGSLSYEYEQNDAFITTPINQQVTAGGIRVKSVKMYDGIDHSKDVVTEYSYRKESGASSGWGYDIGDYSITGTTVINPCGNQKKPGISIQNVYSRYKEVSSIVGSISGLTNMNKDQFKIAGSTANFSDISHIRPATFADVTRTFGVFVNAMFTIANWLIALQPPNPQIYPVTRYNAYSFSAHNLIPNQYARVEVINKNSTDNIGKTVYEFRSDADDGIYVPVLSPPYSSKQRLANWFYGVPKAVKVFDKTGKLVKKSEYDYNRFAIDYVSPHFVSRKWLPTINYLDCSVAPPQQYTNSNGAIIQEIYYPVLGRMEIREKKEYVYNSANDYSLTVENYYYNPLNYQISKVVSQNSRGGTTETNIYYPVDYTMGGVMQSLKDNNILNLPVSTQTIGGSFGTHVTDGSVVELGILSNGDIKPVKTYALRSDQPVLNTLMQFNGSQLNPNPTYYKEIGSFIYDMKGNPVQINSDNDKISSIYDYDNKLPIATISNAGSDDIAYSSFETDNSGGWTMINGSSIVTERFVTGKRSFSGTLNKALLHPGNYTVTLWSLSWGYATVNGQTGTLLATVGDWKLFEWRLSGVSNVQVAGANIDEVRLYPSNARMSTVTYDTFAGKTSECDASNRITYYDYDGLGRLKTVRDEKRNVIKTYEYNYKQ